MSILVKIVDTEKEKKEVFEVREQVFVVEQKVDAEAEYDEFEDSSTHFLALMNDTPCGTARWRFTDKGIKLERIAVLKNYRNKGVGQKIVEAVLSNIYAHPDSKHQKIYLHAQLHAMHLYKKLGFEAFGDLFIEENIEHYAMVKKNKDKNISQKIGFLGGGQLGKMLIQAGISLNLSIDILDPNATAPCHQIAHQFMQGDLNDFEAVYNFGKNQDIISIEIENVNVEALEKLEQEGKKVYPQPDVIKIIKNKRLQKQFYKEHSIPSADFVLTESREDVAKHIDFFPCFQKLAEGGYDGKGVQKLENAEDIDRAFDAPSLLEKAITIKKEISVIVARNERGEIKTFPPVESVFDPKYNLVDYLIAPADISAEVKVTAEALARKLMKAFNMVGILAVELFLLEDDTILVNEVAPRPHNSGHHSIEANTVSQFEQHLYAILDLPLKTVKTNAKAIMLNIIGANVGTGEAYYEGLEEIIKMEDTYIHLYGKTITKPGRKMGHITILGDDIEIMKKKTSFIKNTLVCRPIEQK